MQYGNKEETSTAILGVRSVQYQAHHVRPSTAIREILKKVYSVYAVATHYTCVATA